MRILKHILNYCFILFMIGWTSSISAQNTPPTISSITTSGTIGSLITVNGTNLSSLTSLKVNNTQAIVISNNGTTVVGMVMPGTTNGTVSVQTASGTAVSSSQFTVMSPYLVSTQQGTKLVGSGDATPSEQGAAVALSADGNTAVVAGIEDNNFVGGVWIFNRNSSNQWDVGTELNLATNSGSTPQDQGSSVAISADGNTVIVGGLGDNNNTGAAWVYTRTAGVWSSSPTKLVGSNSIGAAKQGYSVSLSADGNTAIVGGPADNGNNGAAWIFTRTSGTWNTSGIKLPSGSGATGPSMQANAVALSADGNTAIVGGLIDNGNVGGAWIYTKGAAWTTSTVGVKLPVGTQAIGSSLQGRSVSLNADGTTAIVGGHADNSNAGAAWIYRLSGGTWTQDGDKLIANNSIGNPLFGISVSLTADGNTAIVGGPYDNNYLGAAWIFSYSAGAWSTGQKLPSNNGCSSNARQCQSVIISADGSTAIGGAPVDNNSEGSATIYISMPQATVATNATAITSSSFTANWNASSGAVNYSLDVATSGAFGSTIIETFNSITGTQFTVSSGLSPKTNYYYQVRANNQNGSSANSNTINVLTTAPLGLNSYTETANELTVYASGSTIYIYNSSSENVNASVYSISGELMKKANGLANGLNKIQMDGSSPSLYIVKYENNGHVFAKKVMIQP